MTNEPIMTLAVTHAGQGVTVTDLVRRLLNPAAIEHVIDRARDIDTDLTDQFWIDDLSTSVNTLLERMDSQNNADLANAADLYPELIDRMRRQVDLGVAYELGDPEVDELSRKTMLTAADRLVTILRGMHDAPYQVVAILRKYLIMTDKLRMDSESDQQPAMKLQVIAAAACLRIALDHPGMVDLVVAQNRLLRADSTVSKNRQALDNALQHQDTCIEEFRRRLHEQVETDPSTADLTQLI